MSLNGLDDLTIKEAHDSAVAEPGGWFLLKYTSRDEIGLLGRGNGGIVEIRNAIASHEEPSPLYGFLRYRRRNVIIKYVPDNCSRLVQARVTVHFGAITDRFSPHDTIFPIAAPKELRDTTLSAACSLHTASGSTSSSTSSLRTRRLIEIAEEEEEIRAKRQSTVPEERPSTPTALSLSESQLSLNSTHTLPNDLLPSNTVSPALSTPRPSSSDSRRSSPRRSIGGESCKSLQSSRNENYIFSPFGSTGRPKVKLGPRPSMDVGGRPYTSSSSPYRPVSTLPPGLKFFARCPKKGKERPRSQYSIEGPRLAASPVVRDLTFQDDGPDSSLVRPTTSSGVLVRPMPSPTLSISSKMPTMDPARARLLKAQQMRKKKMETAKIQEAVSSGTAEEVGSQLEMTPPASPGAPSESHLPLDDAAKNDDSGLCFDSCSTMKTDESDGTRFDSYPVSPVAVSERAESTKASSLSESTDETLQDLKSISHCTSTDPTTMSNVENMATNASESKSISSVYTPVQCPVAAAEVVPSPEDDALLDDRGLESEHQNAASEAVLRPHDGTTPSSPQLVTAESLASCSQESTRDSLKPVTLEIPLESWSQIPGESEKNILQNFATDTTSCMDTGKLEIEESVKNKTIPLKVKKRKDLMKSMRSSLDPAEPSRPNSIANFSSDDDLMDELQSAVFEDAKPITVSSSVSASIPSPKMISGEMNKFSRACSNPLRKESLNSNLPGPTFALRPESSRSVSASSATAAYLNRVNSQPAPTMAKKANLGSGISQRIKALEKLSALGPDVPTTAGTTAGTAMFFSVRKSNVRASSKPPSIADRASSLNRNTPSPCGSHEPSSPPTGNKSSSNHHRVDLFRSNSIASGQPRSRDGSASATPHILRAPSDSETSKDALDFKNPLTSNAEIPKETILERRLSKDRRANNSSHLAGNERRSSITTTRDRLSVRRSSLTESLRSLPVEQSATSPTAKSPSRPPSTHLSKGHNQSLSITSRISSPSLDSGTNISPPPSATSILSFNDDKSDKKPNRASRMLQRMSSSINASRKSISQAISPTVPEVLEPVAPESPELDADTSSSPSETLNNVVISDVNVQFPDTLLWKRRTMFLDTQGYIIMAPALSAHTNGSKKDKVNVGTTRSFHLSEFRMPSVPDVEIEELPNSVLLDFIDGGGLQVACEDRIGQARILSILQDAHRTWAGQ